MYTHPNATQIDLMVDYEGISSSSDVSVLNQFGNLGATFNLYGQYEVSEQHTFGVKVDNLGFIKLNDQKRYATDSLLGNEGSTINGGGDINEILQLEESSTDVMYATPFSTHVTYQYKSQKKFMLRSAVRFYAFVKNYPQVYCRPGYRFIQKKTLN